MASRASQLPSNSTTTEIIFADDFELQEYALLEIPKQLETFLKENDQVCLQIRGLETDTAVLCTENQTFSLQRGNTSNTLMPIAHIIKTKPARESTLASTIPERDVTEVENAPTLPISMDTMMDLDLEDEGAGEDDNKRTNNDNEHEQQMVLDVLHTVMDLIPISPKLERLSEMMQMSPFEGWAQENNKNNNSNNREGYIYTWEHLQSAVQASDKDIRQWLKTHHACVIQ
ncbi:hypothetical protein BG004_000761, partial [Podila humilis]